MSRYRTAIFAGGCFWCMEKPFDHLDGVQETVSGYAGGHVENPTYEEVSTGATGHREVLQVTYDPDVIGYDKLLDIFWHNIDPFDPAGQFCDKGEQYTTAIFTGSEEEQRKAEESKAALDRHFGLEIATQILPAAPFWPAEDYHQCFYKNNAARYNAYRQGCGRDQRLREIWGRDAG